MDELLNEIESACEQGKFYLAIFCCLTLPDICGALVAEDGEANGKRYADWFDKHVGHKYEGKLSGFQCYKFRCSALHQGTSEHKKLGYDHLLFVDPAAKDLVHHNSIMDGVLSLDVSIFCRDVIAAVRCWIQNEAANPIVTRNLGKMMRRHADGLLPFVQGVAVYR